MKSRTYPIHAPDQDLELLSEFGLLNGPNEPDGACQGGGESNPLIHHCISLYS